MCETCSNKDTTTSMTLNRFHTLFSCFNIDFEQVNTGRGWILYKKTIAIFENFWLFGNPNGRNLFLVNQKDRLRVFALILHIFVALQQILSFWYKIVMTNQVITYLINHLSCFIWVTVYRFCGEGFRIFFKKSKCKHILKLTIYRNLKWNIALSSIWLLFQQKKW